MRNRTKAAVFAALALSGCGASDTGGGLFGAAEAPRAPQRVVVGAKGFTIAGPEGFCVDEAATRESAAGVFVMLGSCAAISGNPDDAVAAEPALLTASVGPLTAPLDEGGLDRLAAFFATERGRAALAREGATGPVEVLDLGREAGAVFVHARDGAARGPLEPAYWRAVFASAGQLVTVTVSGYAATPLPEARGAGLARDFVTAIRAANGDKARPGGDFLAGIGAALDRLL